VRFTVGVGSADRAQSSAADLVLGGGVGAVGVAGYAARQGVDEDTFVDGLQPILTPDQVAKAVLDVAGDPGSAPEYVVGGAGLRPVG